MITGSQVTSYIPGFRTLPIVLRLHSSCLHFLGVCWIVVLGYKTAKSGGYLKVRK